MGCVEQFASSSASQPSAEEIYQYVSSGPNAGLCSSITYLDWNPAAGGLVYSALSPTRITFRAWLATHSRASRTD